MFKPKIKLLDSASISATLEKIGNKSAKGKTKISELLEDFHENGLLLALILFSLPIAVPLPYPPGFTTVLGTPLIILAVQMLRGYKRVQLPKKINDYQIKNSTLIMMSNKVVPTLKIIERYIKPRFGFAKSVYCEQFVGFVSLIASISIALPLPFTNAIPALGIAIMALGLLNRDGLVIIAGFLTSFIGLVIALAAVLASVVWVKYMIKFIAKILK
jgi:hypothetical protein